MSQQTTIKIFRPPNSVGRAYKIDVFVDNKKISAITNGAEESMDVPSGSHAIYAKSLWFKSCTININASLGQTIMLECGYQSDFFQKYYTRVLVVVGLALLYKLFRPTNVPLIVSALMIMASLALTIYLVILVVQTYKPGALVYLKVLED